MRLVSWNLNRWQRREADRWATLASFLRDLDVDVALLQETGPPEVAEDRFVYHRLSGLRAGQDYGTAVVALNSALVFRPLASAPADSHAESGQLWESHPGTIAAAEVKGASGSLILVSVYGRMLQAGNGTTYASTTIHRVISDLVPVLDPGPGAPRAVVAGDFNCTTQWDTRPLDRVMDRSVFARLEDFGLVNLLFEAASDSPPLADCFCPDAGTPDCLHTRTLRHRDKADSRPYQVDYAFANSSLRASARVLASEAAWALSDHAPVLVDLPTT